MKLRQSRSDFFDLSIGVCQGCILSPLLFNLFLSDLVKKLDTIRDKIGLENLSINALFWADDLILMSETKEGLEYFLKILEKYCNEKRLAVNTKKT